MSLKQSAVGNQAYYSPLHTSHFTHIYYLATIVAKLWVAADREDFLVMTVHYEKFGFVTLKRFKKFFSCLSTFFFSFFLFLLFQFCFGSLYVVYLIFLYCWFSHDVTKIQTTKLSSLLRFYFHGVLEQLKTNFQTNFRFNRVLGFIIE